MSKMRKSIARVALLMAGALVAVLALEVVVAAHTFDNTPNVSIRWRGDLTKFRGRVKSDRKICQKERTVTVRKRRNNKPNKFIGTTTTSRAGYWGVPTGKRKPGRFYAIVTGKHIKKYQHNHRCRGGQSPILKLERK